jgi:hypothetical protein
VQVRLGDLLEGTAGEDDVDGLTSSQKQIAYIMARKNVNI